MAKLAPLLCVFAHPDDEAFGPAGTIALESQKREVILVCVTDGSDPTREDELVEIRTEELKKSAEILGISRVIRWDYDDGSLCNNLYHKIARQVEQVIEEYQPGTLLTFAQNGVSGHLDHIALAMIANFVFEKSPVLQELWYYTISQEERDKFSDYFIYFPDGCDPTKVDKRVDVSAVWDKKLAAINAHVSQQQDAKKILHFIDSFPQEELFWVKGK